MSASLGIEIALDAVGRIPAELLLVTHFVGDRPLKGAAGQVDWRLCGLFSSALQDQHLSGEFGEAVLAPSFGRLRAPRVLLLGLGERRQFDLRSLEEIAAHAMLRASRLGVSSLVVPPLAQNLPGIGLASEIRAAVRGAVVALRERSQAWTLRLAVEADEAQLAERSLRGVEAAFASTGVEVYLSEALAGAQRPRISGLSTQQQNERVSSV